LNEFKSDFNLVAQHLKIMNRRMVLLNPKYLIKQTEISKSQEKPIS